MATMTRAESARLQRWTDAVRDLIAPLTDAEVRLACHIYCQSYQESAPRHRVNRGEAMRRAIDQVIRDRADKIVAGSKLRRQRARSE